MKFVLLFDHILIFGSNISFSKYNECLSDTIEYFNYPQNFEQIIMYIFMEIHLLIISYLIM